MCLSDVGTKPGAIFILGNADTILEHSDDPEISHFALIVSAKMEHLKDEELINFAKQDGATVIDVQGRFKSCMVLLRPDADTEAEKGPSGPIRAHDHSRENHSPDTHEQHPTNFEDNHRSFLISE